MAQMQFFRVRKTLKKPLAMHELHEIESRFFVNVQLSV